MVWTDGLVAGRRRESERLSGGHELSTDAQELRWLLLALLPTPWVWTDKRVRPAPWVWFQELLLWLATGVWRTCSG